MIVHYICRGNAFRSIIAEAYTRSLRIPGLDVTSSGTVASEYREYNIPTYAQVSSLLAAHGLGDFTKDHYADDLTQAFIDHATVVVCLNSIVYDEASNGWQLPEQTYVWDINDIDEFGHVPGGEAERQAFMEATFHAITARVDEFVRTNPAIAKLTIQ